jgi:rhodanese-related sulfurtransferase
MMPFCFLLGCGNTPKWPDIQLEIEQKFSSVKQLSIADFQKLNSDQVLLVDVRDQEEFDVSHLKGAIREKNQDSLTKIIGNGSPKTIVLYCSVGYRSSALAAQLQAQGFENVYNLKGSIFEWANTGLPVWKDGQEVNVVHPYNEKWGTLLDSRYHP